MLHPKPGDVLLVVDIQTDFLPGGALGIVGGDRVLGPLNDAISAFENSGLPVIASRDWHPPDHCSFHERGGPWPVHCVQGTPGAELSKELRLPSGSTVISKATDPTREAYSAFDRTGLYHELKRIGAKRVFIGGLATDYCVVNTVLDGRKAGYEMIVLTNAICGVDARPGDIDRAMEQMKKAGAKFIETTELSATVAA